MNAFCRLARPALLLAAALLLALPPAPLLAQETPQPDDKKARLQSLRNPNPPEAANMCAVRKKTGHPYPQPCPPASTMTIEGDTTKVVTGLSIFPRPKFDPFAVPPGTNFLPTIYSNAFDGSGKEMPNTLPSTPTNPYNLHDGDPVVSQINPTSPTDDLRTIFEKATRLSAKPQKEEVEVESLRRTIQSGIDILEGNPIPDRLYSGLPLLHYMGPLKVRKVEPVYDDTGKNVIGGNVAVHQVWYDSHIESDTAFIDPSEVLDAPWTITYTVDVLNRGEDDFSPFVMYFDDPALTRPKPPLPNVAMDQTFFPMENGTRTVFKIKMAPGKYYNLTYTWGWRMHPPRVQVSENANKKASVNGVDKTLVGWEQSVFGNDPRQNEDAKLKAIEMIGELSPEKQMWRALRDAREAARAGDYKRVAAGIQEAQNSFNDWRDRTRLPRAGKYKVEVDRDADLTLLYVNNTIYAEFADRSDNVADSVRIDFPKWKFRGTTLKVTLYNGDYFDHGYQNVDFGGARGWENQFKSSVKVGGSGCWFTFGRDYWWMNVPNKQPSGDLGVVVPAANREPYKAALQKVQILYNYEPSRRLRFYQFDPLHHDVAVLSIH
ncbi:MAG: hypothetical protein LC754_07095 [Acidobacteria bacterium]|nr:hypothetical protein [Acidobacteriota bacterium]